MKSKLSRPPYEAGEIFRLNLVLTYGIPPEFRGGAHFLFKTTMQFAIGSVPSSSGHAIARLNEGPRLQQKRDENGAKLNERITREIRHVTVVSSVANFSPLTGGCSDAY